MFFDERMFFNEMIDEKFDFWSDNNHQSLWNNDFLLLNNATSLFSLFAHRIKLFKHFYFEIFIEKEREQNENKDEFIKVNNIIF